MVWLVKGIKKKKTGTQDMTETKPGKIKNDQTRTEIDKDYFNTRTGDTAENSEGQSRPGDT